MTWAIFVLIPLWRRHKAYPFELKGIEIVIVNAALTKPPQFSGCGDEQTSPVGTKYIRSYSLIAWPPENVKSVFVFAWTWIV